MNSICFIILLILYRMISYTHDTYMYVYIWNFENFKMFYGLTEVLLKAYGTVCNFAFSQLYEVHHLCSSKVQDLCNSSKLVKYFCIFKKQNQVQYVQIQSNQFTLIFIFHSTIYLLYILVIVYSYISNSIGHVKI